MDFTSPHPCRLFIFDLDGTLIDSRYDLAKAVNLALQRMQLPSIPVSRVVEFIGEGVEKLMQKSLREATGHEAESSQLARGTALFREEYQEHLLDSTELYPGVREALANLSWACLAVVSNKPESFSRSILSGLRLEKHFCTIIGGDSTPSAKPDPTPILQAISDCKVRPSETVVVGDSPTDILAGKAARAFTCGILGGYRGEKDLESAGCDLIVSNLSDLANYFCAPKS